MNKPKNGKRYVLHACDQGGGQWHDACRQEGCEENRHGNQIKEGDENRNDVGSVLHYHR